MDSFEILITIDSKKNMISIRMTKNTLEKDGVRTEEVRYYIISFKKSIETFDYYV